MKWLWLLLLCPASAYAQQAGIPASTCTQPAAAQAINAGPIVLVRNSGDQTIVLCSLTVQVTQGAVASDYELQACRNATCADAYAVTPLLPGHAGLFDTYNLPPNPTAQIVLRKGYGLYLTLTGPVTAAVAQAIYGVY